MTGQAVIFDLDGTLADTLADIADATNHALATHGLPPHPAAAYRALVGEGVHRLVELAIPPDRQDLHGAVTAALGDYYVEHMFDRTVPYPGVPELLDQLVARGVSMGVLSNKPQPATRHMVDQLFGDWPFAAVAGGLPDTPLKPDPASALALARALGVTPSHCLYLGDTRTDMETAVRAEMVPIGALWGFRDEAELVASGARHTIAHPLELLDLLAPSPPS